MRGLYRAGLLSWVLLGGLASAAPKNTTVIPLSCGSATYEVEVKGNGAYTPGHITGSNSNLIPFGFGGQFTDRATGVSYSFMESKGGNRTGLQRSLMTCTLSYEDETVSGQLTVTVFMTPGGK